MPLAGSLDIRINAAIQYPDTEIPAFILTIVLNHIEASIHETEIKDLLDITSNFLFEKPIQIDEIPGLFVDALAYNHERRKGKCLLIKRMEGGSFIIEGVVAGLAIYILKETLGETLKEAWKESKLHEKIKDFLLTSIGRRSEYIKNHCEDRIKSDNELPRLTVDSSIDAEKHEAPQININVVFLESDMTTLTREREFDGFVTWLNP